MDPEDTQLSVSSGKTCTQTSTNFDIMALNGKDMKKEVINLTGRNADEHLIVYRNGQLGFYLPNSSSGQRRGIDSPVFLTNSGKGINKSKQTWTFGN